MKRYVVVVVAGVVVIAAVLFFFDRSRRRSPTPVPGPMSATETAAGAGAFAGEVVETMNSGGYTYVCVKTGEGDVWAAGPETPVKVGDVVSMPAGTRMEDFTSEKLNRSFDAVYFVSEIRVGGAAPETGGTPMGHPRVGAGADAADIDLSGIEAATGGKTIAALYAEKKSLAGEEVVVRGKVVKVTPGVMGRNWLHVRDGTGSEGTNDLTVTTDAMAEVGDLVVARGVLNVDKDLGMGYKYEIILENAAVSVE
jgi:hypothetical protein